MHAAEQDRPDVTAARAELKAGQSSLRAPRLVFIDETSVTTKMVRHSGRCRRGTRLVASVPHGHWKTLTLIAALRVDGLTAPYVIDGAMDGAAFMAYIEQVLVPTLAKGDIVFMDNLRTHKVDGAREATDYALAFVLLHATPRIAGLCGRVPGGDPELAQVSVHVVGVQDRERACRSPF